MNYILLFCSVVVATAAPASRYNCTTQIIDVNSTWSLQQARLSDNQQCELYFNIQHGFFAIVDVNVTGAHSETEQFIINDNFFNRIEAAHGELFLNIAYPANVFINIQTSTNTEMVVSITVTVKKAYPYNIVANHVTGPDMPSTVIYLEEFEEGTSIAFKSSSDVFLQNIIDLFTAFAGGDPNEYNNIFVYSGGTLMGTMRKTLTDRLWTYGDALLYCAKKTDLMAAIMATDDSNISHLWSYYVMYSPVTQPAQTAYPTFNGGEVHLPEAFTIISDFDGSTAFDVRNIFTGSAGQVSYIESGPMLNFNATSKNLSQKQLPKHFAGNLTTFYNINGETSLKITVSP